MNAAIAFLAGTLFLVSISRRSLLNPRSHGFYRFIAWECMLVLVNLPTWGDDPYGPLQLVSWALQLITLALVAHAVHQLQKFGRLSEARRGAVFVRKNVGARHEGHLSVHPTPDVCGTAFFA